MNTDKVNALWVKASDDAEGMRLGYTMQHHYFAALIQQQMEADGWRQCAVGQGTTQYCGIAVKAEAENAELRKDAAACKLLFQYWENNDVEKFCAVIAEIRAIDRARSANDKG